MVSSRKRASRSIGTAAPVFAITPRNFLPRRFGCGSETSSKPSIATVQALGGEGAGDRSHRKLDALDVRNSRLGGRRSKSEFKSKGWSGGGCDSADAPDQ